MLKRNTAIDFAKGIAIILVVLGHTCQLVCGTSTLELVIQTVQMPFFMFLSGYCAFYSFPIKDRMALLKKKLFGLYLPYCSWSIILLLITRLSYINTPPSPIEVFTTLISSDFWFLRVLFYIFLFVLLFDIIYKFLKNEGLSPSHTFIISEVVIVLIAFIVSYFPGCYNLYKHLLFFELGVLVHYLEYRRVIKYDSLKTDFCGVMIVLIYILCVFTMFNTHNEILNKCVDYSAAVFGTVGVYYLCKKITSLCGSHVWGGISMLGKMTLGIYAFHWNILFAFRLGDFTQALSFIRNEILLSIIIAVIWMIISSIAVNVLNKWKWSAYLLLGTKKYN